METPRFRSLSRWVMSQDESCVLHSESWSELAPRCYVELLLHTLMHVTEILLY